MQEDEDGKISLSLKGIDQKTGVDSDPTHIQAQQDSLRHKNLEVGPVVYLQR